MDFILGLTAKEKPGVLLVSSVVEISAEDKAVLKEECVNLLLLDPANKEFMVSHGLPAYISFDRAASIMAARYLFRGKGCTLVDFGTTLTVDFIDDKGNYRGGNISLGCRTRFKALNRYSRSLPLVNTPDDCPVIGLSENESIESGVINGIVYEIEGYLALNPENVAVFTGGDANYFAKRMKNSIFAVCNLVLMGLALIADEYVKSID